MTELNFTSLNDTIVPPAYIEQVSIKYPSANDLSIRNQAGIAFLDRYGQQKFSVVPIEAAQTQAEDTILLHSKVFLMLTEAEYSNTRNKGLNLYALVADTSQKINLLRGGDFTFQEVQSLVSNQELTAAIVSYDKLLENVTEVMNDGVKYYKLEVTIPLVTKEVSDLAVFAFTTIVTKEENHRNNLASENLLYGKVSGEIVLRQGSAPQEYYYFVGPDNLIWAGGVHQHDLVEAGNTVYMEGLTHSQLDHNILKPQISTQYKVVDERATDIDTIFDTLTANFNFIEEVKTFTDNMTSEKLSFFPKTSGVSPILSSIVKKEDLSIAKRVAKNTSNLIFLDPEQILRESSIYSSLVDRLDNNELTYVLQTTYIDNFEVERVSILNREERQEAIISTSFKPGDLTAKAQINNVPDSPLTSDDKTTTFAYYEEAQQNLFGIPFQKYKTVTFVDEVPDNLRKSDFYYRVSFNIEDGLRTFILNKIDTIEGNLIEFKKLISILNNPAKFDQNGEFLETAQDTDANNNLIDLLAKMVSSLEFFFNLQEITNSDVLLRSLYYQTNTQTGNIYDMQKVYAAYERLYNYLADVFGYPKTGSGAGSIVAQTGNKEPKNIRLQAISEILNLNFDDTVGLKYMKTYEPDFVINSTQTTTPVFLPAVSRAALSAPSQPRVDSTLSSPVINETFLSFYNLYSIFLDKDYLVRKQDLANVSNNTEYKQYLSILLNDSIRQTLYDKYSGRLDFSTTKSSNANKVLLGNKDKKYQRFIGIRDTLADIGITVDFNFEDYSINNNINDNRNETENIEEKSKFMNLDFISSKLPLSLSKVIQQSAVNDNAISVVTDQGVPNPFSSIITTLNTTLPWQYSSLNGNGADLILFNGNNILRLFDVDALSYFYYNYSLIGNAKIITGFQEGSMVPVYQNLTSELMNEQNLGPNTKYACKMENYNNNQLLTNLFDKVNIKMLDKNFVLIEQGQVADRIDYQNLINEKIIAQPDVPSASITILQMAEQLKNVNTTGINKFEKYFSSSMYVTQPTEVRELRFEFDRVALAPPPAPLSAPEVAEDTTSAVDDIRPRNITRVGY
jgi:uncharacterized protein YihD (DUF1040 family)